MRISQRPRHYFGMSFYRRRLPHWQPEGAAIFLTWRLHGSLPRIMAPGMTDGERFRALNKEADRAAFGPTWLKHPAIAGCVVQALFTAEEKWRLFDLSAWVVMANHVHVLLQPYKPLREVTRAVKATSARDANRILGREGLPFWQAESYDRWVRDAKEFDRIFRYIEWNPVSAGLVEQTQDWPWSSASARGAGPRPAHQIKLLERAGRGPALRYEEPS